MELICILLITLCTIQSILLYVLGRKAAELVRGKSVRELESRPGSGGMVTVKEGKVQPPPMDY